MRSMEAEDVAGGSGET